MEKLVTRIGNNLPAIPCKIDLDFALDLDKKTWEGLQEIFNALADAQTILGDNYDLARLRELVEADRDGRLHIFPVKIGETVWFEDPDDVIRSEKIERHNAYTCTETIGFENSDIGKYVFFSREAAETALKGERDG